MKRQMIYGLLLAAFMVFPGTGTLYGGAWTQEKSSSYHRLAANYYYADKEFDINGSTRSMTGNGDFRDVNLSYYIEYGLIDELTVLASLYYKGY